jgi:hypothetical protein
MTQNKGRERENLLQIEEITGGKAHGNLIKIFLQSQTSFSISRE